MKDKEKAVTIKYTWTHACQESDTKGSIWVTYEMPINAWSLEL